MVVNMVNDCRIYSIFVELSCDLVKVPRFIATD